MGAAQAEEEAPGDEAEAEARADPLHSQLHRSSLDALTQGHQCPCARHEDCPRGAPAAEDEVEPPVFQGSSHSQRKQQRLDFRPPRKARSGVGGAAGVAPQHLLPRHQALAQCGADRAGPGAAAGALPGEACAS